MQTQMTKSQLIEKIAQLRELAKKDVQGHDGGAWPKSATKS